MPTSTGTLRRDGARRGPRVHVQGAAADARRRSSRRARGARTLFVPFADLTTGKRNLVAGPLSGLRRRQPGSTPSTSTRPTTRTAPTTRPTSARIRRASNRLKVPIRAGEKAPGRMSRRAAGDRLRLRRRHRQQRAAAPAGVSAGARRGRHRAEPPPTTSRAISATTMSGCSRRWRGTADCR